MTDRLIGCAVVFERDIREDDAESILAALRHIRGVRTVVPTVRTLGSDEMAAWRVRSDVADKLRNLALDIIKEGTA